MTRRSGARVTLLLAALVGALALAAAPASATIITTQITSPANDTFVQWGYAPFAIPPSYATPVTNGNELTVSGTSTGLASGDTVDIICSFGPGTGYDGSDGAADTDLGSTMIEGDGTSFSTTVDLDDSALDTCTLQAVPVADYSETAGVSDTSDFTGPVIGLDVVDPGFVQFEELGYPEYSYYLFTGTQLDGYMEWTDPSSCGLSLSYPYDSTFNFAGDTEVATEPLFQCAGALYPLDDDFADSEIDVAGYPAYTDYGAYELYYYGDTSNMPENTQSETLDPATGDLTITDTEPLSYCSADDVNPDMPTINDDASCEYLIPAGVTLTRTITQNQNGLQAKVSDQFSDTDATQHSLVLEYDDHIGGNGQDDLFGPTAAAPDSNPTSPAFSVNGGAYETYGYGDLISSFPSSVGSIGIEGEAPASDGGTVADPQPGIADPQGDITYTTAPSQALFFEPNSPDAGDETASGASGQFELTYDRTIPASGAVTITQFYTQSLTRAGADGLAVQAADTTTTPSVAFTAPASGSTVGNPTVTVTGTASDQFSAPTVKLNGTSVPVTNGTWSTQVTLTPGQNTLTAVATNAANEQSQAQENVIYSPPGSCTVPSLTGLSQTAADAALTAAGCTTGTILKSASGSVPSGDVISQNPTAGSKESGAYPVEIVVSIGPASNAVRVDSIKPGKDGSFSVVVTVPGPGQLKFLITAGDTQASVAALLHPGSGRFVYAEKVLSARLGRLKVTVKPTKRGRIVVGKASPTHHEELFLYVGFQPLDGRPINRPRRHVIHLS